MQAQPLCIGEGKDMFKVQTSDTTKCTEDRVDQMWLMDSADERRLAIYRRAAAGARKALAGETPTSQ